MNKIKKVTPHEDYLLELLLTDGSKILLNMSSKLHTIRFGMLADKELFSKAATDGNYIRWDNKIEIAISEVFQMIEQKSNSKNLR